MANVLARLAIAISLALASANATVAGQPAHVSAARVPAWTIPSDVAIRARLADMVDRRHVAPGLVVTIVGPTGKRVIAYGRMGPEDARPVDGDTLFEIGSITKLFTGLLLTDMVWRGEVALDDPAERYAPPGMILPRYGERRITLADLATHTAGLPDFPPNLTGQGRLNPFAGYDQARLNAVLAEWRLSRAPGAGYAYSSVGVGLLGDLLARRADTDYEVLLKNRILGPLGMGDTGVILDQRLARRLSPGHTVSFAPAPVWDMPVLKGAAGMKSSANDIAKFLAAELGYKPSPLHGPMQAMLRTNRPADWWADRQAIGWVVSKTVMGEIWQHEGMTSGYRCYIAIDPNRRTGIVVMANAATPVTLDDFGDSILIGTVRP
ncbi:MAG: beta-lactamase family protein [Proteobacteria bacterium]|nr:beta-lactamase family protein [Pseudomonadota bacterium]